MLSENNNYQEDDDVLNLLSDLGAKRGTVETNQVNNDALELLADLGAKPAEVPQEGATQEFSWKDRGLKALEKGPVEVYGGLLDLAKPLVDKGGTLEDTPKIPYPAEMTIGTNTTPNAMARRQILEEEIEKSKREFENKKTQNIPLTEEEKIIDKGMVSGLKDELNKYADQPLELQKDRPSQTLGTASAILTPLPIPGGGLLNSAKQAAVITPVAQVIKETGLVDDATADLIAAIITPNFEKITNAVKGIGKGTKEAVENTVAKLASLGTDANENVIKNAEKYDIDMPFNVGLGSRVNNWVANNILGKSIFTSKKYSQKPEKAAESLAKAFEGEIEKVSKANLGPSEASVNFQEWLKGEKKAITEAASKKYEDAYKLANTKDTVKPENTAKFIDSIEEVLTRDIESADTKRVTKIISDLAEAWGISSPDAVKIGGDNLVLKNEEMKKLLASFKKELPDISVQRLIGVKKELGKTLEYEQNIDGIKNLLNGLKGAVIKDLQTSKNKDFVSNLRKADKFFQKEVGDRVRLDIANAITTGQNPKMAIDYMSTPENIKKVKHLVGDSEEGKKVFDALREAKIRDILKGGFDNKSDISYASFSKNFKEADAKKQEVLKTLFEKPEQYNAIKEIAEIAQEFSDAGKSMLNTSGTAPTAFDIKKITEIASLAGVFFGVSPVSGTQAAAYGVSINLASRLFANEQFVNKLRAYAVARKNGKDKDAQAILKRLDRIYKNVEEGLGKAGQYISENPEKVMPAVKTAVAGSDRE